MMSRSGLKWSSRNDAIGLIRDTIKSLQEQGILFDCRRFETKIIQDYQPYFNDAVSALQRSRFNMFFVVFFSNKGFAKPKHRGTLFFICHGFVYAEGSGLE